MMFITLACKAKLFNSRANKIYLLHQITIEPKHIFFLKSNICVQDSQPKCICPLQLSQLIYYFGRLLSVRDGHGTPEPLAVCTKEGQWYEVFFRDHLSVTYSLIGYNLINIYVQG